MTRTVSLPLWLVVLILLFAAVTFASHFLFPSVRWFFRKRAERVIAKLNTRLQRPIEPFKLARRYDMIQRLIYDPEVTQSIVDHAKVNGVPENVAFEKARRYAREIVPSFSATAYFTVGTRIAKWISRSLYRIRLGVFDRSALEALDRDATVIFIMNHRSNMDYILVTYLVSAAGALSYAVGEWARIWPLSWMIRAMGAYFIRRRSRGALYRKVLARYVQMATTGGVTQAVFPEGGLSLTGRVEQPKLGLLNYIVSDFKPGGREVIFVPVALNYDRVLEDKFLVSAGKAGVRKFRPSVMVLAGAVLRHFWLRITGQFRGFGTASVGFGEPLELSTFAVAEGVDPTSAVAEELMKRIRAVVPILSIPLVSRVLLEGAPMTQDAIAERVAKALEHVKAKGVTQPRRPAAAITATTIAQFIDRGIVTESEGVLNVTEFGTGILAYYANSIAHHFDDVEVGAVENAAPAK